MQTVTLADCQKITDEAILVRKERDTVETMTRVSLTCLLLKSLATHCRQLSVIDLTKCKLLTDESLLALSKSDCARQLRAISLSGCVQLGNAALRSLIEIANGSLLHLKLSGLYKVSLSAVSMSVCVCRNGLTLLQVDEEVMTTITSLCPALQTLHLASCDKVSMLYSMHLSVLIIFSFR